MANIEIATDYPVHLGFWTNWSHGRIAGATITVTHQNGAFLTAFLAIFITTSGTSFWRIACFAIHQFLSSDTAQDTLYHQRQAILRNAANETNGLGSFIRLLSAWRRKAVEPWRRLVPLLAIALISIALFSGAGVLSSNIGQMGNEVLIASPSCGWLDTNSPSSADITKLRSLLYPFESRRMASYANYVQRCYVNGSSSLGNCGPFTKPRLSSAIMRNASCPFDEALCHTKNGNIRLETIVDSHSDLGLNAPSKLRYATKIITHCAPIVTKGYKETHNFSAETSYTRYFYGPRIGMPRNGYTYEYEQRSWNKFLFENSTSAFADYNIA